MGKKYVVEIGRLERLYKASVNGFGKPNLTWLSPEVDLTPYTDPDLEQVRKEAYDKGWKEAEDQYDDGYSDGYDAGLDDAWEAARKIASDNAGRNYSIFGQHFTAEILNTHSASEAIEKIRQYEQAKNELDQEEENIQVGDEVISPDGKGVVTEITDIYVRIMYEKGSGQVVKSEDLTKTGRHFPEIAEVLAKMKEADNG